MFVSRCAEPPYAHKSDVEMKEDFKGHSVTSPVRQTHKS